MFKSIGINSYLNDTIKDMRVQSIEEIGLEESKKLLEGYFEKQSGNIAKFTRFPKGFSNPTWLPSDNTPMRAKKILALEKGLYLALESYLGPTGDHFQGKARIAFVDQKVYFAQDFPDPDEDLRKLVCETLYVPYNQLKEDLGITFL